MTPTTVDRFWAKVDRSGDCWIWTAGTNSKGYGWFTSRVNGRRRPVVAHRVAWELTYGPIPEGMLVCHHCDNPLCVRPIHLFLGTDLDNTLDMVSKHRHRPGGKTPPQERRSKPRPDRKPGDGRRTHHTPEDIREIRRRVASGESQASVARAFGIGRKYVWRVIHRRLWAHI